MEEERKWKVYWHINLFNNKKYIGITSQSLIKRFRTDGSGYRKCRHFWNAIQKYGWNSFRHELLFYNLTKEQAEILEIELIKYYKSNNNKFGYNISSGGEIPNDIQFSHKKIICIETREVFDSAICLSKTINIKLSKIYYACNNMYYTLLGKHYCYLDNFNNDYMINLQTKTSNRITKSIICLETKEMFNSIAECAHKMNISSCNISRACKKNEYTAKGFHFMFMSEYDENITYELKLTNKKHNCKKVICLDDNNVFNSLTECAIYYNIDNSSISAVCKNKRKSAKGLHFKYY